MHKIFRYPKFSETFRACPRNFLALWDQKFSTEKRDTPFFIHIFFETKNFLKNSRISLRKFSALWDIKISTGNRDMPPLIHKFFSIPENFRKTEGFLNKAFRFGPVRQKVPTKPWCPPPMHENFRWKNFSEAPKCSPMKYFNTVRQKLRRKIVIPPPLIQTFSIPEDFGNTAQKGSPTKFIGTVRQKNFRRKNVIPPSMHKIFWYPKFSETSKPCPRKFSALWDKNFSTEKRDTP